MPGLGVTRTAVLVLTIAVAAALRPAMLFAQNLAPRQAQASIQVSATVVPMAQAVATQAAAARMVLRGRTQPVDSQGVTEQRLAVVRSERPDRAEVAFRITVEYSAN